MDGMWIQNIIAVIALFLIPMTGLTVILTARLAFKPLVESLSKALRETGFATSPELLSEVHRLSDRLEALTEHVQRLEEGQEFDRKLIRAPVDEYETIG